MTKKHPQAEWLIAIAGGEKLQRLYHDKSWLPIAEDLVLEQIATGTFIAAKHRIKPKTITVGKYEVPKSIEEMPVVGVHYYTLNAFDTNSVGGTYWENTNSDKRAFASGLCWHTREDAELAIGVIIELLKGTK